MHLLEILQQQYQQQIAELLAREPQWHAAWRAKSSLAEELCRLWLVSEHGRALCLQQRDLVLDLLASGDLEQPRSDWVQHFAAFIARFAANQQADCERGELTALQRVLRWYRQREWLRIVWREQSGRAQVMESCAELSHLADVCIHYALPRLQSALLPQFGAPLDSSSNEQQLIVLAMGKYGAFELNLSSDIDVILAFPEVGDTSAVPAVTPAHWQSCTIQHFFTRLGQQLVAVLEAPTAEGFVFRTDLRLRPYGNAGAIALSCAAMEEYYHSQGRDWERFAMIKVRAVTGQAKPTQALLATLRAFTYRRYLDFSTLAALRELKLQIEQQVRRKGLSNNIKLGSGGIREIEFIAQVLQVINGGRQRSLQQAALLPTLSELARLRLLPAADAQTLATHYQFLRRLENAIQALRDQQTHDYPSAADDETRLAYSMGCEDVEQLRAQVSTVRQAVGALFANIIQPAAVSQVNALDNRWQQCWQPEQELAAVQSWLTEQGFADAAESLRQVQALRTSRQVLSLDRWGRERLDRFMPCLLAATAQQPLPQLALQRVLPFVQTVLRRSAYLVLLLENPLALQQLLQFCSASPWVVDLLSRYPALLDELLRPLQQPPPLHELQQRLQQLLLRAAPDDMEEQLRVIQTFKHEQMLNVAAAELAQTMPLMQVSDYLTWLAETVLSEVLSLAWQQLTARHGFPANSQGQIGNCDFVVIAYGKLGGLELNYGSDLDLVFLHDGHSDQDTSNSAAPVNSTAFYVQLAQKVLALLGTQTLMGKLYDIDLRLRPSGASGALVSTLAGFRRYQLEEAWTWEHQALVRTRVVAGSPTLAAGFAAVRREVLGKAQPLSQLCSDIIAMRARMLQQHGSRKAEQFDLKQDAGGLIDIEFIVQYLVLGHAAQYPALLQWSDNMRLLDTLAQTGVLPVASAQALQALYLRYRSELHKQALNLQPAVVAASQFAEERQQVRQLWQSVLGNEQ